MSLSKNTRVEIIGGMYKGKLGTYVSKYASVQGKVLLDNGSTVQPSLKFIRPYRPLALPIVPARQVPVPVVLPAMVVRAGEPITITLIVTVTAQAG